MAGLGRRLLGAALVGTGQGILHNAKRKRENTLLALKRGWQVEDREARAGLTREGYDRADARADMALETILDEEGIARHVRRGDAVGKRAPTKPTSEPLVEVIGDDGRPVMLPRSQAAGRSPAEKRPVLKDLSGNFIGYGPTASEYDRQQADQRARAGATADIEAAITNHEDALPEFLGGTPNVTPAQKQAAVSLKMKNPDMSGEDALRRAIQGGTAGRNRVGAGAGVKPKGRGTISSPYTPTTQAEADWIKANAKPGSHVEKPDGTVMRVR